jgi:hypothetical protein
MSGHRGWAPWAIVSAYTLYLAMFHALLRRIWAARVTHPGKRLLLLRVFGTVEKHGRLLDLLNDTWRYVGRIDLIAGTDLAVRTLGSRMLEAFLLRHADDQFLRTDEEVDRRLEKLDSRLEGDAATRSIAFIVTRRRGSTWSSALGRKRTPYLWIFVAKVGIGSAAGSW